MSTIDKVFLLLLISINTFLCQNYLCDWDTKFTQNTAGSWTKQSNCQIDQTNQYTSGAVAWLGGDTSTKSWTDYTIESTFNIRQTYTTPWVGIIFRATSIGNSWDSGNYYFVAVVSSENKIYNSKFNNGFIQGTTASQSISAYEDYTLRIEVTGNSWQIYLASGSGNLIWKHSGSDNSFSAGSIGLRSYYAYVQFKTLYITFPSDSPTKSPSKSPSKYPTQSPIIIGTISPTTMSPTTTQPTTDIPTTATPTNMPITSQPTTPNPTTYQPTTNMPSTPQPTTTNPTTSQPTTNMPSTSQPTTSNPTIHHPTTDAPTTNTPTTNIPTTNTPTTNNPTTNIPTINTPTKSPSSSTKTPTFAEQGVDNTDEIIITQTDNILAPNNGDSKIIDKVFIMEDWMFIVGGALFAVICMTCAIFLLYICKRILKRKQQNENINNDTNTNKYNMTAEMVKIASISSFDINDINQNNIQNISTPYDTQNDTPSYVSGDQKDTKNIFSGEDIINNISSVNTLTPMGGFDDDIILNGIVTDDGNNINEDINLNTTTMSLQNTDSIIVDTFNDGNHDMIIESSDDENNGITMGMETQGGNDTDEQYIEDNDENIIMGQVTIGNDKDYVL